MLEKQLVLKGVMTIEDCEKIIPDIKFDYSKDNYFTELKDNEIAEGRANLARNFQDMVGKYYSHEWVRKNILQQSEDDIEEMDQQINQENQTGDPRWVNPTIENNIQLQQQQQMAQQQAATQQQQQPTEGQQPPQDEDAQKREAIRQAMVTVEQMKKKKGNRTMQDEAKYKAAVQVVAKNRDFIKRMGGLGIPQQQSQQPTQ
jgi:N-acetylmuramoyl-L-alanine amidase CwlA